MPRLHPLIFSAGACACVLLAPVAVAGTTADVNISATITKNTCQVDSSTSVSLAFGTVDAGTAFSGGGWSNESRRGTIVLKDCDSTDVSTLTVTTAQTSDPGSPSAWIRNTGTATGVAVQLKSNKAVYVQSAQSGMKLNDFATLSYNANARTASFGVEAWLQQTVVGTAPRPGSVIAKSTLTFTYQ
ncbi:fimbrial protein [Amantichitinum ursilacus]|uniref:Fimbrial protein n=1 Tax=Amantichitinum ursilacus TaxID=857265 RepID=A0A0N0XMY1_9NEIS|nr:fimbrial protein [Amantichitinum ursilacus]KPC54616.1 Fimbrial protein [Amantichitinum ursilacus]